MKDANNEEFISVRTPKGFKTVIISTPEVTDTVYIFYSGGNHEGTYSQGNYEKGFYMVALK